MRAALLEGSNPFTVEDVTLVPTGPGEVLVRTEAAFACVTDVIQRRSGGSIPGAHIRGHAGAGVVVEVGQGVERARVGDRVVVATRPECGECFWCDHGQPQQCASAERPGPDVAVRADGTRLRASARVGAYAEFMKVPAATIVPVETQLGGDVLSTLGCGVSAGLGAALNVAEIAPGTTVAVIGAGVFGLSIVQGARLAGAGRIVVIEPVAKRRELARQLGASHTIDPGVDEPIDAVRELTGGRGADTAFEAVGEAAAMRAAFDLTRRGGDVVLGGFGPKGAMVSFPANELALRSRRILSVQFGGVSVRRDIPRFVGMIERGDVDVPALLSGTFRLDDVNVALDGQEDYSLLGAVIVP
jgi:S-(hydroxymethyl)glutathione dehydrogenase/alcohol dehydrogenase